MLNVTSAPLSYNNLDQSGIACGRARDYSRVTEEREIGSRRIDPGSSAEDSPCSHRFFPVPSAERQDLEELESKIEQPVVARGARSRRALLDLLPTFRPAVQLSRIHSGPRKSKHHLNSTGPGGIPVDGYTERPLPL